MRVLLIIPPHRYKDTRRNLLSLSDFPSGPAYLVSSLQAAGHEVFGLNLNNILLPYPTVLEMVTDQITRKIAEVQPGLIGMGGLAIDYAFLRDAILTTRTSTDAPIVLGGGIINNDAEYIFNLLKPDYCIRGEAEETVVKLANTLEMRRPTGYDFASIVNLGYWEGDPKIGKFTKVNYDYGEVDARPFPDFEPFGIRDMLDNYGHATRMLYRYTRPRPRTMVITTARGCPFACTFCVHRGVQKYRARSIPNIMAEIRQNYEQYQFNILIIQDELFAVNKKRLVEFCEAVLIGKERLGWDFDWLFQSHASAKFDLGTLKLAKRAGCYFFSYGLESASPTVLKSMNKHTKPEQIIEAIKLAEQTGIGFGGNLIFGDPAETEETIEESLNFFYRHLQDCVVPFMPVQPYPGSAIFNDKMVDKLKYYEHINEGIANMTSMSNEVWLENIRVILRLDAKQTWVARTEATQCVEETETEAISAVTGHSMFGIRALCPHCGAEVSYRELSEKVPFTFITCCTHCHKKIRVSMKEAK